MGKPFPCKIYETSSDWNREERLQYLATVLSASTTHSNSHSLKFWEKGKYSAAGLQMPRPNGQLIILKSQLFLLMFSYSLPHLYFWSHFFWMILSCIGRLYCWWPKTCFLYMEKAISPSSLWLRYAIEVLKTCF